jgi:glycosyltransferase involved in cell wall biosynthesis
MTDLVQVFIPTYNRREMLARAIRSVQAQTHSPVQIVVLDNCSDDGTEALMQALAGRYPSIVHVRHARNLGMIGNLNCIRTLVQAPFFCVLTDDDTYEPHFLSTLVGLSKTFPAAKFLGSNAPIMRDGRVERELTDQWNEGFHARGTRVVDCDDSKHPMFTHCLFRRCLASEFIFDERVAMSSDGLLLTCLASKYDLAFTHTKTGYWLIHGDNETERQSRGYADGVRVATARLQVYESFCRLNRLPNKLFLRHYARLILALLRSDGSFVKFSEQLRDVDTRRTLGHAGVAMAHVARALCLRQQLRLGGRLLRRLGAPL